MQGVIQDLILEEGAQPPDTEGYMYTHDYITLCAWAYQSKV